eukprot:7671725-Pyramimonas_sp.AAC.1
MVASSPEEPVGESRKEAFHVSNVKEGFRDSKRSSRARTKRCLKVRALVDSSCVRGTVSPSSCLKRFTTLCGLSDAQFCRCSHRHGRSQSKHKRRSPQSSPRK